MDIPYPPVHGGRVDIWRRLKMLSELGTEIQLICWSAETPDADSLDVINRYVKDFYPIFYRRSVGAYVRRVLDLLSYPLEVTSRIVRGEEWTRILESVRRFQPDVIFCDHIHSGVVASRLSDTLDIPMVVRSHNIEHLQYRYYFQCALGHQKFLRFLSLINLEKYEKSLLHKSLAFYDISKDDLQFWQQQGFDNGYFLPPLIDLKSEHHQNADGSSDDGVNEEITYDVVFLGNLHSENNVAGVIWFVEEVFPILKERSPDIKVLISGANPVPNIQEICQNKPGLELKINPPSARKIYRSGRVLIDPVATGCGVSTKSLGMLASGKPIVSQPKGLSGLPEEAKQYFRVASDPESYANEIINCLAEEKPNIPDRALLESMFGYPVVQNFLFQLNSILANN
ncbi:glycosyltransferase [Lyngbya sp. CCY1209]|uniref:glycosyltransferase n=1 Tax=Lyngbya sp. CCY1209 TaxID=2886103 RepID=UPI002D209870|nr:glycosyltransferase [Lyngbya sp. CCY1209]MEB3885688.1 glycosyltransferase [Lyngbya sp. CCY1209]